jgi:hypothetical protein
VAYVDQGIGTELVHLLLHAGEELVLFAVHDAGNPVGQESEGDADDQRDHGDEPDVRAEHACTCNDSGVRRDSNVDGQHDAGHGQAELDGVDVGDLGESVDDRNEDDHANFEEHGDGYEEADGGQCDGNALGAELFSEVGSQ